MSRDFYFKFLRDSPFPGSPIIPLAPKSSIGVPLVSLTTAMNLQPVSFTPVQRCTLRCKYIRYLREFAKKFRYDFQGSGEDDLGKKTRYTVPLDLSVATARCTILWVPYRQLLLPVSAAPSRRGPTTDLSFILLDSFSLLSS